MEVFFRLQQLPCGGMEPFMELNLDSTQTPCCYIQTVLYLLFSYSEGDSLSENISDLKLTDILPANKKPPHVTINDCYDFDFFFNDCSIENLQVGDHND